MKTTQKKRMKSTQLNFDNSGDLHVNIDVWNIEQSKYSNDVYIHGVSLKEMQKISDDSGIMIEERKSQEEKNTFHKVLHLMDNVTLFTNDYKKEDKK